MPAPGIVSDALCRANGGAAKMRRAIPVPASDVRALLAGIAHARRIFAAPPLARHSASETMPGAGTQSDEALTRFLREAGMNLHHPVGTCRMGEDPMAVVDSRLRVRGLEGLRVIDASIMPTVTTGNTNAPSIMIGEKGAAMIREDAAAFTAAGAAPSRSAA